MDAVEFTGIRMIAVDLDGTLLNGRHEIGPQTLAAVRNSESAGIHIVLASSRMAPSILQIAQEIQIHPYVIAYGGAIILDSEGNAISRSISISPTATSRVISVGRSEGVHLSVYVDNDWFVEEFEECVRAESMASRMSPTVARDLGNHVAAGTSKLLLIGAPDRLQRCASQLQNCPVRLAHSKPDYLEIVAREVSKGAALNTVARAAHVNLEDVLAIGDNYNDIEMLQCAGYAVVMANAPRDLIQYANFVAPTNEDEGVAFVLNKLGLGQKR